MIGELESRRMASVAIPKSQPQPPSAEEEALKRNTDCVYFLASPLTCKKGSECEYRHSDLARVNPRDCWFWLNANCLNPKCGFQHPPLDGLMGIQIPTSNASAVPLPQTVTTPQVQVVNANNTQGVPCKFFQSGFCLRGDWCPFYHAPNSMKSKVSVVPVTASTTEPSNLNKVEIPMLGKKDPQTNKGELKPVKQVAGEVKPDVHINELSRNLCINELPDYNSHAVSNGSMVSRFISVQQPHLVDEPGMINDKDAGDVSREPSPGFDVLVHDQGRDSDFYHSEDQYGMSGEYTARNGFDIDNLTHYAMTAEADNDRYQESQGYPRGQYGLELNGASPESMFAGFYCKRRPFAMAELDLRHHLTRKKRPHGLRSVIIKPNEQHAPQHENFLSKRLRGRIRFPRRSSSPIDREMIWRDENGRLTAAWACLPSNQRCIQDRVNERVKEASGDRLRNHRGQQLMRDMNGDNNAGFAGPKSLAELKNRKNAEPNIHHRMDEQLGKRKYPVHDALEENGDASSFEGPKPLEEILKQKRGVTVSHKNGSVNSGEKTMLLASVERNAAEESGDSQYIASKAESANGKLEACEQKEKLNSEVDTRRICGIYLV